MASEQVRAADQAEAATADAMEKISNLAAGFMCRSHEERVALLNRIVAAARDALVQS